MSSLRDRYTKEVAVEEVLLDASNIPSFNRGRMEGKRESPISRGKVYLIGIVFTLIAGVYFYQIFLYKFYMALSTERLLRITR